MKLILVFLTILLTTSLSYSQKKLKIRWTEDHKLMNGTKVFIVPPAGFRLHVNSLSYVHNETGANIGAIQSYKPLKSITGHLSDSYFQKKKSKVIECKKLKINACSGVFYELEIEFFDRITTKYILVLGNKNEYVLIESYCPKEYPLANITLKKSMLTSFYDIDSVYIKKMSLH